MNNFNRPVFTLGGWVSRIYEIMQNTNRHLISEVAFIIAFLELDM